VAVVDGVAECKIEGRRGVEGGAAGCLNGYGGGTSWDESDSGSADSTERPVEGRAPDWPGKCTGRSNSGMSATCSMSSSIGRTRSRTINPLGSRPRCSFRS
jgi:hypothetical protein